MKEMGCPGRSSRGIKANIVVKFFEDYSDPPPVLKLWYSVYSIFHYIVYLVCWSLNQSAVIHYNQKFYFFLILKLMGVHFVNGTMPTLFAYWYKLCS